MSSVQHAAKSQRNDLKSTCDVINLSIFQRFLNANNYLWYDLVHHDSTGAFWVHGASFGYNTSIPYVRISDRINPIKSQPSTVLKESQHNLRLSINLQNIIMIYGSSFIYVCRVGYHRQVIFAKKKMYWRWWVHRPTNLSR
jgi:hypothetical protein